MEQHVPADYVARLASFVAANALLVTAVVCGLLVALAVTIISLLLMWHALQHARENEERAQRHSRLQDLSTLLHQHISEFTVSGVAAHPGPDDTEMDDADGSVITAGMDTPAESLTALWRSIQRIPHLSPDAAETNERSYTVHKYWDRVFVALVRLHDGAQPVERRKSVLHEKSIFQNLARPDWVITPAWHEAPSASSAEIVVECKRQGLGRDAVKQAKGYLARRCLERVGDLQVATATPDDIAMRWRFMAVCVEHMSASFLMLSIERQTSTKGFFLVWHHTKWFNFASASTEPPLGMRLLCTLLHAKHEQLGYQIVHRTAVMNGKYRVDKILGSGGYCDVFEVVDGVGGVRTAAKVIRHAGVADESIAREANALQALQREPCEHIPRLVDSDATCLILQPVAKPLLMVLDELCAAFPDWDYAGKFQPEALRQQRVLLALHVARNISAAMQHAHELGYAHADVRLPNILCDEQDGGRRFILSDWGVSRRRTSALALKDTLNLFRVVIAIAGPTGGRSQHEVDAWHRHTGTSSVDTTCLELLARLPAAGAAYADCESSGDPPARTHAALSWLATASMTASAAAVVDDAAPTAAGVSSIRSRLRRRRDRSQ